MRATVSSSTSSSGAAARRLSVCLKTSAHPCSLSVIESARAQHARQREPDEIRHANEELDRETRLTARRAAFFDSSEVFFEIAIVLCSIALLTGSIRFWYVSFLGAALGLAASAWGFVIH